jgi:Superoxide dismutase
MPSSLKESFVAEPKQFNQVSELVSQQTKNAHLELYKQAIEAFNRTSAELDTAKRDEANSNHSTFRSLKLDETYNFNSKTLHELYFANCFDPHSEIYLDSLAYLRIERDAGDFDSWQKDFKACAMSCGEGWVVTAYNMFLKRYVNTIVGDNSNHIMMGLWPVIVLDMHAHAYYRDRLGDKATYIYNSMREFNWGIIESRFKIAESIAEILK